MLFSICAYGVHLLDKVMLSHHPEITPAVVCCREVFADPETKNKIFEMVDLQVQHAQVAGAQFLLPDAPPV